MNIARLRKHNTVHEVRMLVEVETLDGLLNVKKPYKKHPERIFVNLSTTVDESQGFPEIEMSVHSYFSEDKIPKFMRLWIKALEHDLSVSDITKRMSAHTEPEFVREVLVNELNAAAKVKTLVDPGSSEHEKIVKYVNELKKELNVD